MNCGSATELIVIIMINKELLYTVWLFLFDIAWKHFLLKYCAWVEKITIIFLILLQKNKLRCRLGSLVNCHGISRHLVIYTIFSVSLTNAEKKKYKIGSTLSFQIDLPKHPMFDSHKMIYEYQLFFDNVFRKLEILASIELCDQIRCKYLIQLWLCHDGFSDKCSPNPNQRRNNGKVRRPCIRANSLWPEPPVIREWEHRSQLTGSEPLPQKISRPKFSSMDPTRWNRMNGAHSVPPTLEWSSWVSSGQPKHQSVCCRPVDLQIFFHYKNKSVLT